MAKHDEKYWNKFWVEYNETASPDVPDKPNGTDIAFSYALHGNGPRPAHGAGPVFWNDLDAAGVAFIKAAWMAFIGEMAKHEISISPSGRTELTSVPNENTFRFYRAFYRAVKHIIREGEKESKRRGRSVPKEKDQD